MMKKELILSIVVFFVCFPRETDSFFDGTGIFFNGLAYGSGSSLVLLGIAAILESVWVIMIGLLYFEEPNKDEIYKAILEKRKASGKKNKVGDYWMEWAKANNIWNTNPYPVAPLLVAPTVGGKNFIQKPKPSRVPKPKPNHRREELHQGTSAKGRRKIPSKYLEIGDFDTEDNYFPYTKRHRLAQRRQDNYWREHIQSKIQGEKEQVKQFLDECWNKFICQLSREIIRNPMFRVKIIKAKRNMPPYVYKAFRKIFKPHYLKCETEFPKCDINYKRFFTPQFFSLFLKQMPKS